MASDHRVDLLGRLPEELEVFVRGLGQPAYRAHQLFSWLHRGASFEEMSDLPQPIRERLAELALAGSLTQEQKREAADGAAKYAFRTRDGHIIESVVIPHADHTTVCVSSQVGCAFGCAFCATGQQGLTRSLTAGEIVEQVIRVQRDRGEERVRNVVFMGMGEPLANLEEVVRAIRLLNSPGGLHIGARHIAVSTCGLPEPIRRLAREKLQIGLSISLHGATDAVRSKLVPINRTHPIARVMAAARYYAQVTGRKVAFEYVVVPGLNDTPEQARRLSEILRGLPAMVNLIPQNPVGERKPSGPGPGPAQAFAANLRGIGLEVAIRRSRGAEVLGACGQLRSEVERKVRPRSERPRAKPREEGARPAAGRERSERPGAREEYPRPSQDRGRPRPGERPRRPRVIEVDEVPQRRQAPWRPGMERPRPEPRFPGPRKESAGRDDSRPAPKPSMSRRTSGASKRSRKPAR